MFCRCFVVIWKVLQLLESVSSFLKPEKTHPSISLRVKHQTNHSDFLFFLGGGGTISIQWWDDPNMGSSRNQRQKSGAHCVNVLFWNSTFSNLVSGFTQLHGMPPMRSRTKTCNTWPGQTMGVSDFFFGLDRHPWDWCESWYSHCSSSHLRI